MNGISNVAQALTQQQAVNGVVFQVLDNSSLREEVLKHLIFGKDSVDRKAACTLRLVNTSWNESVLRILRQAHEHLFQVRSSYPLEAVDPFVATFADSANVTGYVPPFALHDFGGLCHPENLEIFSNCLTRCGDGLIRLGFKITENGRPFRTGLRNWTLPRLHRLDMFLFLDFHDYRSRSGGQGEGAVAEDEYQLSTFLIKSVLSRATALSELSLKISGPYPVPPEQPTFTVFDSVILPPSITKITTCIMGDTKHLEILGRSPLPNLKYLTMCVGNRSGLFSDGPIIRILENCRRSLKIFKIREIASHGQPGTHHVARFPVMEQLMELSMDGVNVEPELGRDESLEKYFPKLTTLHLLTQTVDMFQKWVGSSPVPTVTSLRLLLEKNSKANLSMASMKRVNLVFPNLRKLEMTMSSDDSSGLEYIFSEMRKLTELEINVECYMERSTCSDSWDSLLTGESMEVIARSRVDPDFWEINYQEDETVASIRNLTELKNCSFKLDRVHDGRFYIGVCGDLRPTPYPSISDFVFNSALLRMPKLMKLHLGRRSSFNVSQEMIALWINGDRSLYFY